MRPAVHRVLTGDQAYDKGGVFHDRARDVAGNGLVTCPDRDRRRRRLMQGAFTRPQLRHCAGTVPLATVHRPRWLRLRLTARPAAAIAPVSPTGPTRTSRYGS